MSYQGDNPVVQLYNAATDKEPFQELPLQACYSVSEIGAQQFDQFGKIFTVKLQYVFYKERPGVRYVYCSNVNRNDVLINQIWCYNAVTCNVCSRPGQVTKAERITNKLSQFAAYAIQGDYQGVKEFGSDLRKLGLPVEHAPQVSGTPYCPHIFLSIQMNKTEVLLCHFKLTHFHLTIMELYSTHIIYLR